MFELDNQEPRYINPYTDNEIQLSEIRAYEESLKIYRDYKNTLDTAYDDGHADGHAEGLAEGLNEGIMKMARAMKATGISDAEIARAMKAAGMEIEQIAK